MSLNISCTPTKGVSKPDVFNAIRGYMEQTHPLSTFECADFDFSDNGKILVQYSEFGMTRQYGTDHLKRHLECKFTFDKLDVFMSM